MPQCNLFLINWLSSSFEPPEKNDLKVRAYNRENSDDYFSSFLFILVINIM